MAVVDTCPTNLSEKETAAKRLRCGTDMYGNNQYICLPDTEKTSLHEICYNGTMGILERGTVVIKT